MKAWLKKYMFALCSASLAYSTFYFPLGSRSNFFFGEPEYPTED